MEALTTAIIMEKVMLQLAHTIRQLLITHRDRMIHTIDSSEHGYRAVQVKITWPTTMEISMSNGSNFSVAPKYIQMVMGFKVMVWQKIM
jgi:hypothetical protein